MFAGAPHGAPADAGLSDREGHGGITNIFVSNVIFFLYPDSSTGKSCSYGFLLPAFGCSWECKGLSDTAPPCLSQWWGRRLCSRDLIGR